MTVEIDGGKDGARLFADLVAISGSNELPQVRCCHLCGTKIVWVLSVYFKTHCLITVSYTHLTLPTILLV